MGVQIYRNVLMAAALALAGIGCESTVKQTTTEAGPAGAPLRNGSRVYVAMPEDAIDKKEHVMGSGGRVAMALQDALKRHTRNVVTAKTPETLEEAVNQARDISYEYVVFPAILKWQDRATEWTGVRDKLQVKIDLVAVDSGAVVRTTMIDGKGKWMTDGEETPQDMLAEPVDKFVRAMFRVTYTPTALQ
jgi:hypothetical protein